MNPTDSAPSNGHPASLPLDRIEAECDFRATRRSGPGGQNRNKVETAVILVHRPTGISAEAAERRSQGENRQIALFRLRLKLALEIRRPLNSPEANEPSPLWKSRCRGGRIAVNPEHDDFPSLLAEALDQLEHHRQDPRAAGDSLGCSASQLVKFLKNEPRAFAAFNASRADLNLRPLS